MITIHIVYPHAPSISSPNIIGYRLGLYFSRKYNVKYYRWDGFCKIKPMRGDVLIGHPNPVPFTTFQRSVADKNWAKKIMLCPFTPDIKNNLFLEHFINRVDCFMAISGEAWFDKVWPKEMDGWREKIVRLDYPVDTDIYKNIIESDQHLERKKILYIGSDHPGKGLHMLDLVAGLMPDVRFDWYGPGRLVPQNVHKMGMLDLSKKADLDKIKSYSFIVSLGTSDANPATIVEGMALGLIPISTRGSGYHHRHDMCNLRGDNPLKIVEEIRKILSCDHNRANLIRFDNLSRLKSTHKWITFCEKIENNIKSVGTGNFKTGKLNLKPLWRYEYAYPYQRFVLSAFKSLLLTVLRVGSK